MACLNQVTLVGRMDVEPDLRETKSGVHYVNIKVATWKKVSAVGEDPKYETDWHLVSLWDKAAENCYKHMRKGQMVIVQGELKNSVWLGGPNRTEKRFKTEIRANKFLSLDRFITKSEKPLTEAQQKQLQNMKPNED